MILGKTNIVGITIVKVKSDSYILKKDAPKYIQNIMTEQTLDRLSNRMFQVNTKGKRVLFDKWVHAVEYHTNNKESRTTNKSTLLMLDKFKHLFHEADKELTALQIEHALIKTELTALKQQYKLWLSVNRPRPTDEQLYYDIFRHLKENNKLNASLNPRYEIEDELTTLLALLRKYLNIVDTNKEFKDLLSK